MTLLTCVTIVMPAVIYRPYQDQPLLGGSITELQGDEEERAFRSGEAAPKMDIYDNRMPVAYPSTPGPSSYYDTQSAAPSQAVIHLPVNLEVERHRAAAGEFSALLPLCASPHTE